MKLLRTLTVFVLAFALLGFAGCSDDEDDDTTPVDLGWYNDFEAAALDYMNTYTNANISAQGVFDGFAAGTDMFIIDWRSATAYAEGHIDIATATGTVTIQNWAIGDLDEHLADLPTDALIINVCYTGQTASQATAIMKIAGFDNARNMLFGMCGWTGTGNWVNLTDIGWTDLETTTNTWPTETYQNPVRDFASTELDAALFEAFDAYLTDNGGTANITAAAVQALVTDGDATNDPFVINYWPAADYEAGHIPGAYQLTPGADGFSSDVLDLLPTDGTQIVVYCYTGQTSSQMTSILRTLGYNAYSLAYGMNAINQQHTSNHGYTAPTTSFPTVAE